MSHKANFWLASLDPNRVKSGAFRVLFHLCDHHNGEADPRVACYPSQETLRARTGLSNGALNTSLADMESEGLIARRRSTVPGSSERRTYYILGCDMDAFAKLTPENGVSPNSGTPEPATEQTPVLAIANSSFGPSKLRPTGEEPVRTGKNQEEKDTRDARAFLCRVLSPSTADAFIAHRKAKRSKLTPHAAELIAGKLAAHPDPDAVVETSIMQGWTGVFPEKFQHRGSNERSDFDTAHREYTRRLRSGEIQRGPDPSDPFAR